MCGIAGYSLATDSRLDRTLAAQALLAAIAERGAEAVFAVAAHSLSDARAFEVLEGSMAAAWLDERLSEVVHVARGVGRPLWLGECRDGIFFASTRYALEVLDRFCELDLRKREV